MQRKTKKIFEIISILLNILLIILIILSIITKDNNIYAWYWTIVPAMLICEVLYIHRWDKINGIDVDKKESKSIRRAFDGITTGTMVLSGFIYLAVNAFEMINQSIKDNIYVIILVYAMLTTSLWLNFLAISTANKDTKALAEKMYKYKK